ncbi:hypothetical protein [uncultured Microbulbifer sp.]|uniref:hypothetical protein n=1 Tax=uncultured Microbulbifer sp. TaxID=348147 RepID=UPI0025F12B9D|nr:hypothetical protein [uncultured Microbulbifer sp.]
MHLRRYRNGLNHCLWALLVCFLAVRGLVPAGFMPAPLSTGGPYQLCHGDSRAAQLLNSLQASPVHEVQPGSHHDGHHQDHQGTHGAGHDHDPATAKHFADSTCAFAAAATGSVAGEPAFPETRGLRSSLGTAAPRHLRIRPTYFTPPGRAPPAFS